MRGRDIIQATGISRASLTSYVIRDIVRVQSVDRDTGERNFAEDSIETVRLTKTLTGMGFRLAGISRVLSRLSVDDVRAQLTTLTAEQFREWVEEQQS